MYDVCILYVHVSLWCTLEEAQGGCGVACSDTFCLTPLRQSLSWNLELGRQLESLRDHPGSALNSSNLLLPNLSRDYYFIADIARAFYTGTGGPHSGSYPLSQLSSPALIF